MNLQEFKTAINDGRIPTKLYPEDYPCFIFVYEDNPFIAKQYIQALAEAKEMEIQYISSLDGKGIFEVDEHILNVYNASSPQDITQSPKNTVILCAHQKGTDELPQDNLFNFPALKDWQIKDYILSCCPGLRENEIDWIYSNSQGDIYNVQVWIDKLQLFDKMIQSEVLAMIIEEENYTNHDPWLTYKLASAIMKKDKKEIVSLLSAPHVEWEPFGFLSILRKTLYNIMCIQFDGSTTAESLGLKPNQFKALSYSCNKFSNNKLLELFKFLNDLDSKIKSGQLIMNDKQLFDYVIINMWR